MAQQLRSCGIIVLAAGSSTRLGQPKQLLPYGGKTLLRHCVDEAVAAVTQEVIVVLGANAASIEPTLATTAAHIAHNENWEEGMGATIHTGMAAMQELAPHISHVLLLVCDQPFITTALLNNMLCLALPADKDIIACSYAGAVGTPVLFGKKYFARLLQLQGQQGAKTLLQEYACRVETMPFSNGYMDVDTMADYEAVLATADKHKVY